jgi:hypothetical protein
MNATQFDDLKQFILATVSQSETSLEERLGNRISSEIASLREDMLAGFAAIADIISPMHDSLDDHESRLTKLEQRAA